MEKKVRASELGFNFFFCNFFSITFGVDFFHSGQFPTEANPNLRKSVFLTKIAVLDIWVPPRFPLPGYQKIMFGYLPTCTS